MPKYNGLSSEDRLLANEMVDTMLAFVKDIYRFEGETAALRKENIYKNKLRKNLKRLGLWEGQI